MTEQTRTYKYEEVFEEDPNDPENVLLNIPPEICEEVGLEPGDPIRILLGDQGTLIIEKVNKTDNGKK